MRAVTLARQPAGSVTLDLCATCQALWFDTGESQLLTPGATIDLFRAINDSKSDRHEPLPSQMHCPRCDTVLEFTHDLQRTTHFTYYRCQWGHGRFTPFVQFLLEKNFIRPLAPQEIDRLRAEAKAIRCSGCGAPIDLTQTAICPYCHAPIMVLDADAVTKTLRDLSQAERDRVTPDANKVAAALTSLAGAQRMFESQEHAHAIDLVGLGLSAVLSLIDHHPGN